MSIDAVNGIVQPGQTDPTTIRVAGSLQQCPGGNVTVTTNVTGTSGPVASNSFGRWAVDLPVTATGLECGDSVQVQAVCSGTPTCNDSWSGALPCCEIPTLFFSARTPAGSLTPSQLVVDGVLRGCAGDQVVVSSSVTGTSPPIPSDPVTGAFKATLNITTPVQCDEEVTVTATCASTSSCARTEKGRLTCTECYRAAVTVTTAPCIGSPPNQQQPVTLGASIAIAAGASMTFYWDFGDGSQGPQFTISNATGTAATTHSRSETHNYDPGTYTATLKVVGPPYECDEVSVQVVAQCGGGGPCPQVVADPPQVAAQCVSGKRSVTLSAQVTAPSGQTVVAQWDFGDGSMGAAQVVNPGTTAPVQTSHDYLPGTYTATLKTVLPANCPDVTVQVVVPPCTPPPCTLQVQNVNTQIGPCNADGTRTVTATAVLSNTDPADLYYWTWDQTPAQIGLPASQGTTQTHDYPAPGTGQTTYTVTLTVVRSSTCVHSFSRQVVIDGCGPGVPCPQVTGIAAAAGNCAAGATTRPVNLNAQGSGGNAASYEWDFGDGSPIVTTNTPAAPVHNYAAPSTATATVTAKTPGCPDSTASTTVSVAGCPPPPNGGGGGGGGLSPCDILLWVALILMLIGGLVALVGCVLYHWYPQAGLVVMIIGFALLALGLILFIIWWIVCRFRTACSVLLAAIDFVTALIFVFGIVAAVVAIIAIVVNVPSMWGCFAQAALTWAGWGVILALLVMIARQAGCLIANPSGGQPSSSSSPLTSSGPERMAGRPGGPWMSSERPAGLGDLMKGAFATMGVQPCEGCAERARRLNQRFPLGGGQGAELPARPD